MDNVALYGSTTVSDTCVSRQTFFFNTQFKKSTLIEKITFGEGNTENVFIILSGYSSRILDNNNVPIPDPVPPPNECAN